MGVDRCTHCSGILFDAHEREKLLELGLAAAVDVGDESMGRRYDAVNSIDCPRCKVRMLRMVDVRNSDVHFEQCADCGSSFLDAGELRALGRQSLGDWLRRMLGS